MVVVPFIREALFFGSASGIGSAEIASVESFSRRHSCGPFMASLEN